MSGEKRYIPGTNPKWGVELPEGMTNSLVDAAGNSRDDKYNFDEWDDEVSEFDKEAAEQAREERKKELGE